MSLSTKGRQYPYPKSRVFLSAIIFVLSTILAITLLLTDTPLLLLGYFFATVIVAAITFFLKKRLYRLLITENQVDSEKDAKLTSWKMLLTASLMLIGFIVIPLLLAGLLSGPIWFMMITSFMSGVSVSEIVIYTRAGSDH